MPNTLKVYRRVCALCRKTFVLTNSLEGCINPAQADDEETLHYIDERNDYACTGVNVVIDNPSNGDAVRQNRCTSCDVAFLHDILDEIDSNPSLDDADWDD
jgi:hypothetical protein